MFRPVLTIFVGVIFVLLTNSCITKSSITVSTGLTVVIDDPIEYDTDYAINKKHLLIASAEHQVTIKKIDSGKTIKKLDYNLWRLCFSANGRYLAGFTVKGKIYIWDVLDNWKLVSSFKFRGRERDEKLRSIALSPSGKMLAARSSDVVYLYENTGRLVFSRDPGTLLIGNIIFENENSLLVKNKNASGLYRVDRNGTKKIFYVHDIYKKKSNSGTYRNLSLVVSPNGAYFAAYDKSEIYIYTTKTMRLKKKVRPIGVLGSALISDDGMYFAGSVKGGMLIIDLNSPDRQIIAACKHSDISLLDDNMALIVPWKHNTDTAELYDLTTMKKIHTYRQRSKPGTALMFNAQSDQLVSNNAIFNLRRGNLEGLTNGRSVFVVQSRKELFGFENGVISAFKNGLWKKIIDFREIEYYKGYDKVLLDDLSFNYSVSNNGKFVIVYNHINDIFIYDTDKNKIVKTINRYDERGKLSLFYKDRKEFRVYNKTGKLVKKKKMSFVEYFNQLKTRQVTKENYNPSLHHVKGVIEFAVISDNGRYAAFSNKLFYSDINPGVVLVDLEKSIFSKLDGFYNVDGKLKQISSLVFSPDNKHLAAAALHATGFGRKKSKSADIKIWQTTDGRLLQSIKSHKGKVSGLVVSTDSTRIASWSTEGGVVKVYNLRTGRLQKRIGIEFPETVEATETDFIIGTRFGNVLRTGSGPKRKIFSDTITSFTALPDNRIGVLSDDCYIKVLSMDDLAVLYSIFMFEDGNHLVLDKDGYYFSTKEMQDFTSFKKNGVVYEFEDFDLSQNRPDKVFSTIGLSDKQVIDYYSMVHKRRIEGVKAKMPANGAEGPLRPEIILERIPLTVDADNLNLEYSVKTTTPVNRMFVTINGVPLYGKHGKNLQRQYQRTRRLKLPLLPGYNRIKLWVRDNIGRFSQKTSVYVFSKSKAKSDIYVMAVGAGKYRKRAFNLNYAAKDAGDIIGQFKKQSNASHVGRVHRLLVTDKNVTKKELMRKASEFFARAKFNDLAILFIAGHGFVKNGDYFFGTYDVDPLNPEINGLSFDAVEDLLFNLKANRKLVLMDTCFSGAEDLYKDLAKEPANRYVSSKKTVASRGIKLNLTNKVVNSDIHRIEFNDIANGTGAVVISSSGANEYSYEGGGIKNGVFTHVVLNALKTKTTDINSDNEITIDELKGTIPKNVSLLTAGGQTPSVRSDNINSNFTVYYQ